MKKQTLVILAIIAVITTLLTVSALSNEVGYKLSPCDAIDISLETTAVTDFLNATNMTTVQVYNFKGYRGENTWMVQWSSSNRSLDVYVNVATGNIAGIEKITVPEAIKRWVAVNYGDGTRVTSDGWRKLSDAEMANTLAPLPAGYTKADITDEVYTWAMDNPNYTVSGTTPTPTPTPTVEVPETICGWINSIGVTNLTEDHGLYVYSLATNWTVVADSIYDTLSPKPSRLPAALATEDNGRAVYYYAIGCNTIANEITGCNFWTTPTPTQRVIDTVEIGVEIVGPTPTPSVTPTEPPDAIKAWIVANYGHGMRVSSIGWLKLSGAMNSGTLAPLPAGYTSANITQEVVTWAKNNPNYIATTTPTPKTWHLVTTFEGRGTTTTPYFEIKGTKWRINWQIEGDIDEKVEVLISKKGESWPAGILKMYPYNGIYNVYDGPSEYCMDVYWEIGLEYWSLTVEDYY